MLFALSVFFVNHVPTSPPGSATTTTTFRDLRVPGGIEQAKGMERVELVRQIVSQVGVTGEIRFIRFLPEEHRLVIPIVRPGLNTMIDLNVDERTAVVSEYRTPFWERLSYLHRSPGPHNVAIRGNWFWTRAWRWVADATVYLVLFLSVSGLYLWALLRPERRVGLILLAAGPARLHREPPWQSESCQRRLGSEPSYSPEHSDQFLGCDEGAAHFQRDARQ